MVPVKTSAFPLANSLLLLVIAAGVLNIDLFEVDARGGDGRGSLYRLELVLDSSEPVSDATSVVYNAPHRDEVKAVAVDAGKYPAHSRVLQLLSVAIKDHPDKAPSFRSSYHARAFNIPHQNSDEDETSSCAC
jgi:hypothetical protein